MKKIFYICSKNQHDWAAFIPRPDSPEETDISVLLLHHGRDVQDIPSSEISILETGKGEHHASGAYQNLSYQQFLEKIFLADLPLVI